MYVLMIRLDSGPGRARHAGTLEVKTHSEVNARPSRQAGNARRRRIGQFIARTCTVKRLRASGHPAGQAANPALVVRSTTIFASPACSLSYARDRAVARRKSGENERLLCKRKFSGMNVALIWVIVI